MPKGFTFQVSNLNFLKTQPPLCIFLESIYCGGKSKRIQKKPSFEGLNFEEGDNTESRSRFGNRKTTLSKRLVKNEVDGES